MENNPNFVHVMFVNEENILFQDEAGFAHRLLELRDRIVHKGAYRRFVKYADSQLHKMRIKPANYKALEEGLEMLDSFGDNMVMADVVGADALRLEGFIRRWGDIPFQDHGNGKHIKCGDLSIERGVFVKKARKMIRERLSKATSRAVLFTKYGYDTKFASNLIHLLMSGRELMETGQLVFPLTYAQDILDVKQGKYSAQEIEEWAEQLREEARQAYEKTELRSAPWGKLEDFAMAELYKWSQLTTRMKGVMEPG